MRPLKNSFAVKYKVVLFGLLGGLLAGFAEFASAAPGQIQTSVSSSSTTGSTAVDATSATGPKVSNISSTVGFRSPGLLDHSTVATVSITNAKNDYTQTTLADKNNQTYILGNTFDKMETTGEGGLEFKTGGHTLSGSISSNLSTSPYAYKAYGLNYNYGFFSGATVVGGGYSWSQQKQPVSFHIDPRDLQFRQRPNQITAQRTELWVEQILSDRWKMQVKAFEGIRLEDRPSHFGGELRQSYAIADRLFSRLDFGAIRESKSDILKDERGRYSIYWGEAQLSYEVIYDFLLTASFGSTLEKETIEWNNGVVNQVGTDTYGLKAGYTGSNFTISIGGQTSRSNTTYRSDSISGDITWQI